MVGLASTTPRRPEARFRLPAAGITEGTRGVEALVRRHLARGLGLHIKTRDPIKYDNYFKRVLQPAAKAVGVGEITHQMLRRSFSTVAVDSDAPPKDIQHQMRRRQASISLHCAKSIPMIPMSVKEEVDKLAPKLWRTPPQPTRRSGQFQSPACDQQAKKTVRRKKMPVV
jgi:hypothetical protein